ncbi:MAG TPA: hypothetical protein VGB85_00120 [Nannocystis sp.]|jgi:hypothetical protein
MSRRVHMPKLGHETSILEKAPLLCGQTRDTGTLVTVFAYLATCSRCVKANAVITYQHVQAKLRRERGEEQVSP